MDLKQAIEEESLEKKIEKLAKFFKQAIKKGNLEKKIEKFARFFPLSVFIKDLKGREVLSLLNSNKDCGYHYPIVLNGCTVGTLYVSENSISTEYIIELINDVLEKEQQIADINNETLSLYKEINLFYDLSAIINKQQNLGKRLECLLDRCVVYNKADNASIWIIDEDVLKCICYKGTKPVRTFNVGEGFIGMIAKTGGEEMLSCPVDDKRWIGEINQKKSIICKSLCAGDKTIGILNVSMIRGAPFTAKNLKFVNIFAHLASQELEINRLFTGIKRETVRRTNLARFLSPNIVDKFADQENGVALGGKNQVVSILFADIVNFTGIAEQLGSDVIVSMLNEYFTIMTEIIFMCEGTLDKFIGDSIMAIFGAPNVIDSHAVSAVRAGLLMQQASKEIYEKSNNEGESLFKIRIGINTGMVTVGNIGSPNKLDYTAIGDNVNIASRIESSAGPGTVLIGAATNELVKDVFKTKKLDPVFVKGKDNALDVYEVIDGI